MLERDAEVSGELSDLWQRCVATVDQVHGLPETEGEEVVLDKDAKLGRLK